MMNIKESTPIPPRKPRYLSVIVQNPDDVQKILNDADKKLVNVVPLRDGRVMVVFE